MAMMVQDGSTTTTLAEPAIYHLHHLSVKQIGYRPALE